MRLDLQTHQLLNQDQADVQERHGQLRVTDHHLRPAAASRRHIVNRQTESRNGKKTPSSYGDGGTQPKLGLHKKNPPSSADFYHLQLPQM